MELPTVTLKDIIKWKRCSYFPARLVKQMWGQRVEPVNAIEIIDAVLAQEVLDMDGDPVDDLNHQDHAMWAAFHVVPEEVARKYWNRHKTDIDNPFPDNAEDVWCESGIDPKYLRRLLVAYQKKKPTPPAKKWIVHRTMG